MAYPQSEQGLAMSRRRFYGSQSQRGFSLLEVLVAFALLGMALGVLLQVFSTGLNNAAISAEYTQAVLHGESLLAGLGIERPLIEGVGEGEIDAKFSWRSTVTLFDDQDDPGLAGIPLDLEVPDLSDSAAIAYRVEVEVFWRSGSGTRSLLLETLRLARRE